MLNDKLILFTKTQINVRSDLADIQQITWTAVGARLDLSQDPVYKYFSDIKGTGFYETIKRSSSSKTGKESNNNRSCALGSREGKTFEPTNIKNIYYRYVVFTYL